MKAEKLKAMTAYQSMKINQTPAMAIISSKDSDAVRNQLTIAGFAYVQQDIGDGDEEHWYRGESIVDGAENWSDVVELEISRRIASHGARGLAGWLNQL